MVSIQAAATGAIVNNKYFLVALPKYTGCLCCAATPQCRIPLTIMPLVNPIMQGFKAPTDFAPKVFASQAQITIGNPVQPEFNNDGVKEAV